EDAAGLRDSGRVLDRDRSGRGAGRAPRGPLGRYEGDDAAVDDEAAREEPDGALTSAPVAQHDDARLGAHHEADEAGGAVFDDVSRGCLDNRIGLAPAARSVEVGQAAQDPAIWLGHAARGYRGRSARTRTLGYKLAAAGCASRNPAEAAWARAISASVLEKSLRLIGPG